MIQDLEKRAMFRLRSAVNEIAKPLLNYSDIDGFCYYRIYQDNTLTVLSSDPTACGVGITSGARPSYHILSSRMNNSSAADYLDNNFFYIRNNDSLTGSAEYKKIITIAHKNKDFFETFGFAIKDAEAIKDCFINWRELLRFNHYFKSHAHDLIACSDQDRIEYQENNKLVNRGIVEMFDKEKLKNIIDSNSYYLYYQGNCYELSKKYLLFLRYLSNSMTFPEIGKIMNKSPRTLEDYQVELFNLLGVDTRRALVDIFLASNLCNL